MTEAARKFRESVKDPSLHFRPECEGFRCGAHKSFDEGFEAGYAYQEERLKIAIQALEEIQNEQCAGDVCTQMWYQDTAKEALAKIRGEE